MQKSYTRWDALKAVGTFVFVVGFVALLATPHEKSEEIKPTAIASHPEPKVKFDAVMSATEPCRMATKDLLRQLQVETIKLKEATSRSQAISETCFNDRLKVLALGMDDPAEHLCVSILSSNQAVLRSIRYAAEEPTMAHLRELSRWVNELPETEQQCAISLAT